MSVNSAMKSIADKIRAIRGTSAAMGLSAMATNLSTVQGNIASAYTAVRNKGGTVPSSQTSGNLASAISSIPITTESDISVQPNKKVNLSSIPETVWPDTDYDAVASVTIESIPPEYANTFNATATASDVLSGKTAYAKGEKITGTIPTRTSASLTASEAIVIVPAGYYANQVGKSVTTATQATPTIDIDEYGVITSSATQAAGYVSEGTKSADPVQLTTQEGKIVTPTKNSQTAVAKNVYTTGEVKVGAIPDEYVIPSGTVNITQNGTHNVREAENVYVSVSTSSTGIDTSDATATAADILKGKTAYAKGEKIEGSITSRTSSNLAVSNATVIVPPGYYASTATKSVATATQATPVISVSSAGVITSTATQTAGYVAEGTTRADPVYLTTESGRTITPTKSTQTAVAANRYTLADVKVGPIPREYQDVSGVTATADDVVSGKKIVNSSGTTITGTNPYAKAATDAVVANQESLLDDIIDALAGKALPDGTAPSGTITITSNGSYNVTNYAQAVVNVANTASALPNEISEIKSGTFTVYQNTTSYTLSTALSGAPDFVSIVPATTISSLAPGTSYGYSRFVVPANTSRYTEAKFYVDSSGNARSTSATGTANTTSSNVSISFSSPLAIGVPYVWVAGTFKKE